MARSLFIIQANIELRENMIWTRSEYTRWRNRVLRTANPTRVAIEELQLQDLKNIEATAMLEMDETSV
jgi:hypothetical protein